MRAAGYDDDWRVRRTRILLQCMSRRKAIHDRHVEVHDYGCDRCDARDLNRRFTISCLQDVVAIQLQRLCVELANVFVVIDD